jgi:hypothetical protein
MTTELNALRELQERYDLADKRIDELEEIIERRDATLRAHRAVEGVRNLTVATLNTYDDETRAKFVEMLEELGHRILGMEQDWAETTAQNAIKESEAKYGRY